MLFSEVDWRLVLGACFVLWLAFRTLPSLLFLLQILRYEIQQPQTSPASEEELPAADRSVLLDAARGLERNGFEPIEFVRALRLARSANPWSFGLLMYCAERRTCVELLVSESPDRYEPVKATFWTFFEDGPALMTVNGQDFGLLCDFPGARTVDRYVTDLAEQLEVHLRELEACPRRAADLSPPQFVESINREQRAYFALAQSSNTIRPRTGSSGYELSWSGALRMAWALHRRLPKLRRMQTRLARRFRASGGPAPLPVEIEVEAYRRAVELRSSPNRRQVAFGLLVLSGLAFCASMLFYFPTDLLLGVVLVLLLHEGGHFLAMKGLGYQNTSVFFIPFIGAAAKGVKDEASVWDELIVLLAGPLPGLLLGLGLASVDWQSTIAGYAPGIEQLVLLLIVINLFNLLPIYPLDGGRIVHRLFFVGRPYGEAVFAGFGSLAFILAGVLAGDIMVLGLGTVLSLAVWQMFKRAELEKRILRELPEWDSASILPRLFRLLDESANPPLAFPAKVASIQYLRPRLARLKTGWVWALAGAAAYLISIWIGVIALV